jgi:hypothetical protein
MKSMSDPEQKIAREELHSMVWTRPFVRLAKELGYSYLELVAICEDLNIPRPSGGYWGRLERGLAEGRVPLPPVPPGKPTQIQLGSRRDHADTTAGEPDTQAVLKGTKAESGTQEKSETLQGGNDSSTGGAGGTNESDAVDKPVKVEYTREQLHEAIWSKPCVKLAAELGLSNVALAKTCRRMGTWVRNVDRYPPNPATRNPNRGNVFLSSENVPDGKWRLLAMDHTHCFDGPGYLDANLAKIDFMQDDQIYGLFPEFIPFLRPYWLDLLAAVANLKAFELAWIQQLTAQIPNEWQVEPAARAALAKLVYNRADFLSENFIPELEEKLLRACA